MKKIALSLLVIAASGGYVLSQAAAVRTGADFNMDGTASAAEELLSTATPPEPADPSTPASPAVADPTALSDAAFSANNSTTTNATAMLSSGTVRQPTSQVAPPVPASHQIVVDPAPAVASVPAPAVEVVAPVPAMRPPRLAVKTSVAQLTFVDGSYTGSPANAYYGLVQVKANVQNGQLVSVKILQYPSDRRTSRYINSQALPILQQEAVSAQSAHVDAVSGATLTSEAYIASLTTALQQARSGAVRS